VCKRGNTDRSLKVGSEASGGKRSKKSRQIQGEGAGPIKTHRKNSVVTNGGGGGGGGTTAKKRRNVCAISAVSQNWRLGRERPEKRRSEKN